MTSVVDDLNDLKALTDAALAAATDLRAWDAVRIAVLGRNGSLTGLLRDLGKTPPEQRRRSRRWRPRRSMPVWPMNGSTRPCRRGRASLA